ncbi:MAG: dockerin type I repeat-containing protein, partial [Candidatus Zixiibacteriota bacterium]
LILENCEFTGNIADQGPGGAISSYGANVSAENCLFKANLASAGSAISGDQTSIIINNSTLALNGQDTLVAANSVIICQNGTSLTMDQSIIAFNSQCQAVWCENINISDIQISCSDLYGNENGDWVDCLAGMDEINDNLSSNPMFCDTAAGDLHIDHMSPCSPSLSPCGQLIGAFGVGCGVNRVTISPATMYVFYANALESATAAITLSDLGGGYTVYDVNVSLLTVNNVIIPSSSEIIPGDGDTADRLILHVSLSEFVSYYGPLWDTTIQEFTLAWMFNDESESSASGVFKMIGHRSGDVNGDGIINLNDIIYLINYLYIGGPEPLPVPIAGDVNTTGTINLGDIIYLIKYLFRGGPAPTGPLLDPER